MKISNMAFLCPAGFSTHKRRRRSNKQNAPSDGLGERQEPVTEFEPTRMIVVQDFVPCVDDELQVKRGQYVKALYQENEWRYVVSEDGKEGFIPYTYCIPVATAQGKNSILKQENAEVSTVTALQYELLGNKTNINNDINGKESVGLQEFVKRNYGEYVVLFDYNALQEDDIEAEQGEKVILLNKDDNDWYWVQIKGGEREGFIPRQYLQKVQKAITSQNTSGIVQSTSSSSSPANSALSTLKHDDSASSFEVKKLIVTSGFFSQSQHELTVRKGEEIFTDDNNIDQLSWIWAYSPQTRKSGFVPTASVRWSQNTTFL